MKHNLRTAHVLAGPLTLLALLVPALASANPEPTAYDTKQIAMGLTGTSHLERPAALALNPANLEGIPKLGFTINMANLFVNQQAPVMGPNTSLWSGIGYGPLPSGFIAGRIAPRVVFAGGVYIETGYGSDFTGVRCLDGAPVNPNPEDGPNPPFTPDTNPNTCTNGAPQDLSVRFFVGEFAAGFSFRVHEKFWVGAALRLPWSKQIADLWANTGAALGRTEYGKVKNDLGGVGMPTARFGITIKPHKKVDIGVMYRVASKINMTGTTETSVLPDPDTGQPLKLKSTADWYIPHAIQFGLSSQVTSKLLLALEARLQFHGASKSGNKNQTVVAKLGDVPLSTVVIPFGWKNVWSIKGGADYRFRGGFNIAMSATTAEWAQYFTPPPGLSGYLSTGFGFNWKDRNNPAIKDKYQLDIAGAYAFTVGNISDEYIGTSVPVPGAPAGTPPTTLCSADQVIRTGCPGDYKVNTFWATFSFTLQY